MRLPSSAHAAQPWRIHELAPDFRLEDVWELPTRGDRDDFPALVATIASADPSQEASLPTRALWSVRWALGALLRWDRPEAGLGARVPTLRDRLPADLRDAPRGPDFRALPFRSLYLLEDEWAAEIANRTMHGVLHLGWVPGDDGRFRGRLAVLVKPEGRIGEAYMLAIRPFRHRIVYPQMLGRLERRWARRERARAVTGGSEAGTAGDMTDVYIMRHGDRWAVKDAPDGTPFFESYTRAEAESEARRRAGDGNVQELDDDGRPVAAGQRRDEDASTDDVRGEGSPERPVEGLRQTQAGL